jgi:hypothetical protein
LPDYRLYIDESGDHTFRGVAPAQWDKRYLCLFGCWLDVDYCHTTFGPEFERLKRKHFGGDPDDPVILHREDMKARRGPFSILRDTEKAGLFHAELLDFVRASRFTAIAVVVDKLNTQAKHFGPVPSHPYHIGLLAMMERYCGWLNFQKRKGDVLAESRGGREDLQLKAAYRSVYSAGTRFRPKDFFQGVLTSKEIKIKPKTQNIPPLQLADLFAYPAKRYVLFDYHLAPEPTGFTMIMARALEQKYNVQIYTGQVNGYGKVILT